LALSSRLAGLGERLGDLRKRKSEHRNQRGGVHISHRIAADGKTQRASAACPLPPAGTAGRQLTQRQAAAAAFTGSVAHLICPTQEQQQPGVGASGCAATGSTLHPGSPSSSSCRQQPNIAQRSNCWQLRGPPETHLGLGLRLGLRLGPSVHFHPKKSKSLRMAQSTCEGSNGREGGQPSFLRPGHTGAWHTRAKHTRTAPHWHHVSRCCC
jgi:hypothetical protein